MKTASRGIATIVTAALVVAGFTFIMRDDDENDRRAVHFSATWSDKQRAVIEYGLMQQRNALRHVGHHWDENMMVRPGDKVFLRVSFHGMNPPDSLKCWITVNNNVHDANDPGQKHSIGGCQVVVTVR